MTTAAYILAQTARIVKDELPQHMPDGFTIDDVQVEYRQGPEDEDYIHVNVILQDDHPDLDPRKQIQSNRTLHDAFIRAGIDPTPVISYSKRGEMAR